MELASSVLEGLGFDPLPGWRADPDPGPDWPLMLFTGVREDPCFQTRQRHVPEPLMFLHGADAAAAGLAEGGRAVAETHQGEGEMTAAIRADMPKSLVRIPHGRWLPEAARGDGRLSGARQLAEAQICADDPDFLDAEQGIPHLEGIPCRVRPAGVAR